MVRPEVQVCVPYSPFARARDFLGRMDWEDIEQEDEADREDKLRRAS